MGTTEKLVPIQLTPLGSGGSSPKAGVGKGERSEPKPGGPGAEPPGGGQGVQPPEGVEGGLPPSSSAILKFAPLKQPSEGSKIFDLLMV